MSQYSKEYQMPRSIEFGCSKCDRMFNSMPELAEHEKEHKLPQVEVNKVVPTPVIKPVVLKYVYQGQCSDCSQPVTTLEIDVEKKHFCIAMCTRCNKQVATREVLKL